ncbi:MAG: ABC-three component system middle component 1 [Candidatus Paceibacterota bacterium]
MNKNIVPQLSGKFPDVSILHREVVISHVVHVFIIEVQNEELLNEFWKRIRDYIAVYFQNTMESDYERWNLYLIYVCRDEVSKELKYKIENDQISSRKIIVDNYKDNIDEKTISSLVNRYIKFSFSMPIKNKEVKDEYSSSSNIYKLIQEKPIPQIETKRRKELDKLYLKIVKALS